MTWFAAYVFADGTTFTQLIAPAPTWDEAFQHSMRGLVFFRERTDQQAAIVSFMLVVFS